MFKQVSSKVDFSQLERETLKYWQENKILEKYLARNEGSKEKFKFLDGPITANNPMGVHHAWGRTYKDLWQRFFNMLGRHQRFQNGFDEQGLWVEVEVEKDLGLKTKKDIENLVPGNIFESIAKFVNLCKERVKKYSVVQTEQSKRLGYFMDWENSYHTSSDQNNYAIWSYLKTIHEKGWLYKGRDTVPWCPRCGTAISQHEILTEEYQEVTHKAVYFKLPITSKEFKEASLLVWTTTPWTILGNVAVAVHPEKEYALTDENLILIKEAATLLNLKVKKTFLGRELIGQTYEGPFDELTRVKKSFVSYTHKIINGEELVTEEEGTGLVHIAPGAGEEDFKLGQEEKLPVIELIDEGANYIDGLGEFSGKNAKDHPELILDYLEKYENGKFFFSVEDYKHRYPTCWRCKTELVWRVVDEWYIAMDRKDPEKGKTYREMMKEVIKGIKWIPSWGYERELDWLNNMHDWLISKKRYWGLALPIWECKKCGKFELIGSKEELKEKAVNGWKEFDGNSPHRPWVDQVKIKCSKCGESVSRIPDVGNPWLDAGIVPFSTLNYFEDKDYWKEWFPADFITESFPGQFKNWFYSLIAMSTALEDTTSFKILLGHGQVKDEKDEEMHKSKGNAIWFDDAAEKMGVDVMRWIYLTSNPENNVNFGYHIADEVRKRFFLILWNVYVFFVTYASLDNWKPQEAKSDSKNVLDRFVLSKLNSLLKKVKSDLTKFDAMNASRSIEYFVLNDLSTWYLRRSRDRMSPISSGENKEEAYGTLYFVLTNLCKLMAPFTPFVVDEIYRNLTDKETVHLEDFPETSEKLIDKELENNMEQVRKLAEVGHSIRKQENMKLRQPLTKFNYGKGYRKLSEEFNKILMEELNVKAIVYDEKTDSSIDMKLTKELKAEGEARDFIRVIQEKRKEAGVAFNNLVTVYAPTWPKNFEELIKKETLAKKLIQSSEIKIEKD
jgi:isoleucyl-tRNA synthetase